MTLGKPALKLAVIGFGPRGLGALEALAPKALEHAAAMKIDIFDTTDALGAGPNFHPDEDALCILNIPVRALDIDPPDFLSDHIAPFAAWSSTAYAPDDFPPRCDLGAYLTARYDALRHATRGIFDISHLTAKATALTQDNAGWWIGVAGQRHGPYDEVLLSLGQPETQRDPQMQRWTDHAGENSLDLITAYPGTELLDAAENWRDTVVAVRGLGLSTHDVLRILTIGLSGQFKDGAYLRSGREPRKILPFSRDGMPPVPKPANAAMDALFDLSPKDIELFVGALAQAVTQPADQALKTICDALVMPTMRILTQCNGSTSRGDIEQWLETERTAPGTQDGHDTRAILRAGIEMAHQRVPPSIGYVIGQIWRKLQNEIRAGVNSAIVAPATASAIVGFDEGFKRYSYGPPVAASEQLLILIEDGLVGLQAVDDPDILLEPAGWRLIEGDDALLASSMVDAVLPSPKLENIMDPFIKDGSETGLITEVDDGSGARTRPDGSLVARDGGVNDGLCLLGRLSLGSVIATDSLHDCFGASTHRWAAGLAKRRFP